MVERSRERNILVFTWQDAAFSMDWLLIQIKPDVINSSTYITSLSRQLCFIWSVPMNCRPTWIYVAHSSLFLRNQLLQYLFTTAKLRTKLQNIAGRISVHSSDYDNFYWKMFLGTNSRYGRTWMHLLLGRGTHLTLNSPTSVAYILRCRDTPDAAMFTRNY